uniref:Uncharacterized protein n=1 Tax=Lotus japonicus TaxID=34305 RepID=I3SFQ4_LOTJA|nr:unknown [Lotus japonicus]
MWLLCWKTNQRQRKKLKHQAPRWSLVQELQKHLQRRLRKPMKNKYLLTGQD